MLNELRRLVQEVDSAAGLEAALDLIVRRVRAIIRSEVCSVYLLEPGVDGVEPCYVLGASDGFDRSLIGKVRLRKGAGLVGFVAERAEPVNLANGHRHPRFEFVPETGEDRLYGFVGAPIIRRRQVLGVIVVQRVEKIGFSDDELSFLVTLASQLSAAITHAESLGTVGRTGAAVGVNRMLMGLPGAPGVASGRSVVVYSPAKLDAVPDRRTDNPALEEARLRRAVDDVRRDVAMLGERLSDTVAAQDRAIFDAYCTMLSDDSLVDKTVIRIRQGQWAPAALRDTVNAHARVFAEMDDPYLAERASDIRDLGRRVLLRLQSEAAGRAEYPDNCILVGEDVTAMNLAEVPPEKLRGIVSVRGSGYSHVAILARSIGIPCVMGVSDLPVGRVAEREMIADGYSGRVYVEPSAAMRDEFERLQQEEEELSHSLATLADLAAQTPDGRHIPLYANAGLLAEFAVGSRAHVEGVGLYRTEFPFIARERFPTEDEQYTVYRQALEAFHPGPVVIRTLDAGGDKVLPYFPISEENPFLGWRGIRLTLDQPTIFLSQLRAMLRANEGLGNLQILLPMISSVHEVDEANALLCQALTEVQEEGIAVERPPLGLMIEVPSMVFQIDDMAKRVDFFSIGTNDLTQYLLAVDRNNERVAALYDHLHPAVIRALVEIVDQAHRHRRLVSVCGEMADDPAAVILLIGMGVDSLSMASAALPRIKWVVRSFRADEAMALLNQSMAQTDAAQIRRLLTQALVDNGLGGLVRAGKR